ncbi:MAG: sigma-70 family RNA polymerase sigma factor [Abditibacteriales bacterium]|nr:sigma-70 family RNA polymerase sigma factor [Abditibacteriales bacterium]MDW8365591.1 sigma-70 family RNA polymerase sigma factor [Abditibacteriales bacterium]
MEAVLRAATMTNDDDALVARCRAGEQEAFRVLIDRHQRMVYSVALRMLGNAEEATDVAQETFVRAYMALDRYKPGGHFGAWLRRIAVNLCLNERRRPTAVSLDEVDPDGVTTDDPVHIVLAAAQAQAVRRAIHGLPPEYRAVVVLRYLDGLSYRDIAQSLGVSVPTVETRLHRAKKMLQERLQDVV